MTDKVCKGCGYVGQAIDDDYSSFMMDLFAWLLWFAIGGITGIFPLVMVGPAFSLVHFLFFFRDKKCPKCANLDMVGLHSESGRHVIEPHEGSPQPWSDTRHQPVSH